MQYILTQDEYETLRDAPKRVKKQLGQTIQDLCSRVACSEPITRSWHEDGRERKPWGCIRFKAARTPNPGYCDECPVQDHCPEPDKSWSK